MDQSIHDGLISSGVVSISADTDSTHVEDGGWQNQNTDGGIRYLNAASCPDCGSGMVRLGSCFSCPLCGWGGCGAS